LTDFDLTVRNATLITAEELFQADLAVQDGKIVALGHDLHGKKEIDASGKWVLPGAVDPHVHLQMPAGLTTSSDSWETGTIAAACGGTTTILDFIEPEPGQGLLAAYAARRAEADGQAVIDYGLHMTLSRADPATLAQIPQVVAAGMPTFKTYTTYDGLRLDDQQMLEAMCAVKAAGGLVMVHAENHAIVEHEKQKLLAAGRLSPASHPLSRPAIAEGEAIHRVIALAEISGASTYIVHVSTGLGAEEITIARAHGLAVFGETCPQYLLLTGAEYERDGFEGAKFVCSPPLREPADQNYLWQALATGNLQTVGTDHCPFFYHGQKDLGREDFTKIPGGIPGIEARLSLMFTFGVGTGRISLNQWVEACCTAPACLFGLYPRKGSLKIGADADLVIFDPEKKLTLSKNLLHEQVDYSPYEGLELVGYPQMTISRGRTLVQDGQFTGPKGQGRYLAGKI